MGQGFWCSERDADSQAALPDQPAAFPGGTVKHLETLRQIGIFLQLQARTAGRIIDQRAIDDGRMRPDENLGVLGNSTPRPQPGEQSLLIHQQKLYSSKIRQSEPVCLANTGRWLHSHSNSLRPGLGGRAVLINFCIKSAAAGEPGGRPGSEFGSGWDPNRARGMELRFSGRVFDHIFEFWRVILLSYSGTCCSPPKPKWQATIVLRRPDPSPAGRA